MGFLRLFYRYGLRENWLVMTGRSEQAMAEADADVRADMETDREGARSRAPYRAYRKRVDEWKVSFEERVAESGRRDMYRRRAKEEWPSVPAFTHSRSLRRWDRLWDNVVLQALFDETVAWRENRLREFLGFP
jgi:hypothetical protein